MTIKESTHGKFEESNTLVKNVVKIDFLDEDMKKISLKDSQLQEDNKPKKDEMVKFKILKWIKFNHF